MICLSLVLWNKNKLVWSRVLCDIHNLLTSTKKQNIFSVFVLENHHGNLFCFVKEVIFSARTVPISFFYLQIDKMELVSFLPVFHFYTVYKQWQRERLHFLQPYSLQGWVYKKLSQLSERNLVTLVCAFVQKDLCALWI